jgi:hypothetical protein
MKRISIVLVTMMIFVVTSCEKDELTPPKPNAKEQLKGCRTCEGSWDRSTDSKP